MKTFPFLKDLGNVRRHYSKKVTSFENNDIGMNFPQFSSHCENNAEIESEIMKY
jgi:hypothetical protein